MHHVRSGTLAASNVSKSHGSSVVLDGVSLAVPPRSRIGVVGPNGIGKSTLLRILAAVERPDAGSVTRLPPDLPVGYLPQETDAREGESLLGYLSRRTGVADAERELDALTVALEADAGMVEEHAAALERFLELGGSDLSARAGAACAEVGLAPDRLEAPMTGLSGGERARAALAGILLARFGVLLLDEPTNDLDFDGLERLERFVADTSASVVVVSHDRAFLARVVERVLEFEDGTRRAVEYAGGWAEFDRARRVARERHYAHYAEWTSERRRFAGLHAERREQARVAGKQAHRRGTHALMSKTRAAARRLEQLDAQRVEKPWEPWQLQLGLAPARRSGDVVAALERAVVERGSFRLGPVDLELRWGERVTLVGPNGSGKTTLLAALLGHVPLAAGRRRVGPSVVFGELDQRREAFGGGGALLAGFRARAGVPEEQARTLLAKFGLGADDVLRPAHTLSPGERTRAAVALLAAAGANCLILDEPTNHLDLPAIEELEAALERYSGTLVLVTHDRRLVESFRATRTIELGPPPV